MLFESEKPPITESRTPIISFRVTAEEFERSSKLCGHKGVGNVLEVVTLAGNQLLTNDHSAVHVPADEYLTSRLEDLESTMAHLEMRLARNHIKSAPVATHAINQ